MDRLSSASSRCWITGLSSSAPTGCAPNAPAMRGSSPAGPAPALRRFLLLAVLSALAFVGGADADSLRTHLHPALDRPLAPLEEIIAGGPPPDGIPAIDKPVFVSPAAADAWLKPTEPVLAFLFRSHSP